MALRQAFRRRTLLVAAASRRTAIAVIGPESPAASVPPLPQGWRWESFGGVQVGVPVTGVGATAGNASFSGASAPMVRTPATVTSAEGDSLLIRRNGVDVTIIAEPALRRQIAGTVHLVDVDINRCPTRDPVSTNPTKRPTVVQSVQSLGDVQSVSVCQYRSRDCRRRSRPRHLRPRRSVRCMWNLKVGS